jgi:hypothetical protein
MTPPAAAAPAVQPRPRGPLTPGRPYSPRPRRVSGPARPARAPGRERGAPRRPAPEYAGVALGAIEGIGRLSTHPALDRLIRGRTWIAIVAFALIGIVTLQLGLLKLNAGIGHSLRLQASLQRENAALSIENSELAAGDVVESRAGRLGMEVVPTGALRFLTARPGADSGHGAAALKTPVASASASGSSGEAAGAAANTEAAKSSSGGEAAGQSGETTAHAAAESTTAASSESQEAKPPAGEASESSASQASSEASREERTSSAPAAAPSGGGSTEPSGGTQAGTTGR